MKDRIPTKPGRIALTDEDTGVTKYYIMTMADEPVEDGTELNKASLLKDATAAAFGLTDAAVPDDVFALIASGRAQIEVGTYTGTGVYGSNNKNSITFSFVPKMVLIRDQAATNLNYSQMVAPYIFGNQTFFTSTDMSTFRKQVVDISGTTMNWYSDGGSATTQMNASGKEYEWIAIG